MQDTTQATHPKLDKVLYSHIEAANKTLPMQGKCSKQF